jgi:hypothetical protein
MFRPSDHEMTVRVTTSILRTEDLAGLRNLARLLGDKFVAGYVLYTGQQTLSYGGRIKALPSTHSGSWPRDNGRHVDHPLLTRNGSGYCR